MSLNLVVLGAGAGGGFPQWNCGCPLCARARAGDPAAPPRTQVAVAATGDGERYLVIGASPDLRQQILATPALTPRGPRATPITDVVLLNADIDGMAGLLVLREQSPFRVLAPQPILDILAANDLFRVLDPALVERRAIVPGETIDAAGLSLTLVAVPGKVPLYHETLGTTVAEPGVAYAARLEADGRRALVAPACADITPAVEAELATADLLLFDGTLFTDDEMLRAGLSAKTARRMGHVPVTGEGGSLDVLARLPGRALYLHVNNSNPILLADSPERARVAAAGVGVAEDGMVLTV